ncbi:TetR/AcrR family transcriptional regulator [Oceanobacillus sp. CAU 1775]
MKTNRRTRKTETTRRLLRNAFIDLLLENNHVESITVSEIASRADFNRGTFYTHYQDKFDLLEDIYLVAVEGIHQSIIKPYKDMDRKLIDNNIPSLNLIFNHIENFKKLYKVLDFIDGEPNIYHRLEDFLWNLFTEEIKIEQKSNATNTEYEILLSFQIHATLGVIKYWIKNDFKYPAHFMTEQLTSLYTNNVFAMNFKNDL